MSEEEGLENELAGKIQQLLLPKAPPICNWCCIGVKNRMAAGLGGDYFDFLPTHDGCQMVMIGDVTGHGVAASVVMALLYGYIHRSVEVACSPYEVLHRVNAFLGKFAARSLTYDHLFSSTLFFGVIHPGTLEMHYINAAHPAPLVRRRADLLELEPTTSQVGFFDIAEDSVRSFRFEKDDRLLLYTDGISETASAKGELFGTQRLKDQLLAHRGDHLEFLDHLFETLTGFNGSDSPRDDCTAIVMDFHRPRENAF